MAPVVRSGGVQSLESDNEFCDFAFGRNLDLVFLNVFHI
jgi:hypothetical protein